MPFRQRAHTADHGAKINDGWFGGNWQRLSLEVTGFLWVEPPPPYNTPPPHSPQNHQEEVQDKGEVVALMPHLWAGPQLVGHSSSSQNYYHAT
jgi:hypothetical protein